MNTRNQTNVLRAAFSAGLAMTLAGAVLAQGTARIAVAPLASPFNSSYNVSAFGGQIGAAEFASFGPMISDLLANELISKGFAALERANVDQILKEQLRVDSGAFDDATAAQIGKLALANLTIVGTVNEFSFTSKRHSALGVSATESKGNVGITIRLVKISDGMPLDAFSANSSKTKWDFDVSQLAGRLFEGRRGRGGWGSQADRAATWGSMPLISDAAKDLVKKAVKQFAPKIAEYAKTLPAGSGAVAPTLNCMDAKVFEVTGNEIVVELGPGFKKGDAVTLSRCEGEIKNDQGKVIKRKMKAIGSGTVSEVSKEGAWTITVSKSTEQIKKSDTIQVEKDGK